jgi:endonuclease YncB( thermonuclease family)
MPASARSRSGLAFRATVFLAQALRALALGILALTCLGTRPVRAEVQGKPRIIDGATLEVGGQRFRLAGIEVPALDRVCQRLGQEYACGKVARAMLWDLVAGREVSCRPVGDPEAGSPAGAGARAATCTAGDTSLNEGMVATGWAVANPAGTAPYDQLENDAKAARRGLWTGEFEPPANGHQSSE